MATSFTDTSSAKIAASGGEDTALDALDVAITAVSAPAAMTSAAATGGDAPTEAEHNAVRTDVVNLRGTVADLRTALVALGD